MADDSVQRNQLILARLVKNIVAGRFKQMARDEILSRFSSQRIDPVLLVDLNLQVEREAIELTEVSLLELVTPTRLLAELKRSSLRIQKGFQMVYGEDHIDFLSPSLINLRMGCLRARVDFFNPFLVVVDSVDDPIRLAQRAFQNAERFTKKLEAVLEKDRLYFEELTRSVAQEDRFLMKKQCDYEMKKGRELWAEFGGLCFKERIALP